MGDRANIKIIQHDGTTMEEPALFLYSHWGGDGMANTLKRALIRGASRWDDEIYLARIIFNEMTKGDENETTGFGISTYIGDNEHPIITVDCEKQTVTIGGNSMPFTAFVALDDGGIARFYR